MWWIFPNGKHCLPKASHRLSSQLQGHDGNACNSNSSSITNLPFTMIISFYHLPLVLTGRMNDIASDWLNHTVFLDITFIWVPSIWAVELLSGEIHSLLILMFAQCKHQYERWEKTSKIIFFPHRSYWWLHLANINMSSTAKND